MRISMTLRALAALAMTSALATPVLADSIHDKTQRKEAEIPTCSHKIGSIAVYEPENKWWVDLKLESPEALIKVFVMRSGCFTLVDRGKGFSAVQQERDLASQGQLQQGSSMGKGQIKAADYVLVPDVVSRNANSGGSAIGGILGGFIGGGVILKMSEQHQIVGITTAASIWLTATIGIATGAGRLGLAVVGTILAYIILTVFGWLEREVIGGKRRED